VTTAAWLHKQLNSDNKPSPVKLEKFSREKLAKIFGKLGFKKGAEIGVAGGRHSAGICQRVPGLDLLCVDTWARYRENPRGGPQEQHDKNYELAQTRLAQYNATLVRAKSMDAVRDVPYGSLDFCYIDGNHSFDYVMTDMVEWGRRVRQDGIIAGHDYYPFKWAGVIEAVEAYVRAHHVPEWFVTVEREPSWFFCKTPDAFPHRGW